MRYISLLLLTIALCGCDNPLRASTGRFALFETSKGTVYRLDTTSGGTEVIYSPSGWPKLTQKTIYKSEDGKTYEYLGAGKLRELSTAEAADRIIEKYPK